MFNFGKKSSRRRIEIHKPKDFKASEWRKLAEEEYQIEYNDILKVASALTFADEMLVNFQNDADFFDVDKKIACFKETIERAIDIVGEIHEKALAKDSFGWVEKKLASMREQGEVEEPK